MKFNVLFICLSVVCSISFSQKLPKIQQGGMRAPSNIKIDGVDKEWKDTFSAYNEKLKMFYTMSNDDSTLYLVIKIKDVRTICKVAFGGIELLTTDKKSASSDNMLRLTYPFYSPSYSPWFMSVYDFPETGISVQKYNSEIDSIVLAKNRQLISKMKLIGVGNGSLQTDTAISIYNSYPVSIRSKFDKRLSYLVEFAIPRKSLPRDGKIYYKITLNGASVNKAKVDIDDSRRVIFVTGKNVPNRVLSLNDESLDFAFPTYFSGEYTFIK